MAEHATYLWLIEWDDEFVTPQRVEVRHVTRLPGVTDEALERRLVEHDLPAQAAVSTRVGGVRRQLLVRCGGEAQTASAFGSEAEGVATVLGKAGVAVATNGEVVWSSDSASAG